MSIPHPEPGREPVRVYVDMVGDLFHPGHVALLRAARACGDRLVVGVLSDEVVEAYKRRPVMTLAERVAVIAPCRYVDDVVPDAPYRVTNAGIAAKPLCCNGVPVWISSHARGAPTVRPRKPRT
jgi:cytidyltransferase-like protein